MVVCEEAVHILEGAVCCFGVEEVDDGDEGEVEDCPDDVELPAEGGDAWWCDFDNLLGDLLGSGSYCLHCRGGMRRRRTMKLTIQFVAVPRAAPFVRMDKLLISVGYNQGTPILD